MGTKIQASNLIAGEWRSALNGRFGESVNPADQEVIGAYPGGEAEDARMAIAAARKAFAAELWSRSPRLRQLVLLEWADRLERCIDELSSLLTQETGKVLAQSRGELINGISSIRYYAGLARHTPGHVFESEPGTFSTVLKEPAGVVGIIIPWNAPAILLIRALAPALAAGCTAVVKPAPEAALIAYRMLRELDAVKTLPPGVANLICESSHKGAQELAQSFDVDVLVFIGSTATAARIAAAAAPSIKRLSLELGGSACCLVFEDAPIDKVAASLAAATTVISGQHCTAARRISVHASRYAEMKQALTAAFATIAVGPGNRPESQMGPLINARACQSVQTQIQQALDSCDEVLLRGRRLEGEFAKGNFLTPTLVAHQDNRAAFCQEEVFGPFAVLSSFESEQEAVARANDSQYGLAASVWTHNAERVLRVARAVKAGTVWINDHNRLFTEAETGGYRRSGIGRLNGIDGLDDFLEAKHICQRVDVLRAGDKA